MADHRASRRSFLLTGGVVLAGMALPACTGTNRGETRCLWLSLEGGASHVDTFDPKRTSLLPTRRTSVAGLEIADGFSNLARLAERFAFVRGMRGRHLDHAQAGAAIRTAGLTLSGQLDLRPGAVARVGASALHPAVLSSLDERWRQLSGRYVERLHPSYRDALHLGRLPQGTKVDAHSRNALVQDCETALRLLADGASFVEVEHEGWDTHVAAAEITALRIGELDEAIEAIASSLDRTGGWENTLLVIATEFGRSPSVDHLGGREHHADAWSVVLAGAGVRGGVVVGETDAEGGAVTRDAVDAEQLGGFVLELLGSRTSTGRSVLSSLV